MRGVAHIITSNSGSLRIGLLRSNSGSLRIGLLRRSGGSPTATEAGLDVRPSCQHLNRNKMQVEDCMLLSLSYTLNTGGCFC